MVRPALQFIMLLWWVLMCLAFTRYWEWNLRMYCDSSG